MHVGLAIMLFMYLNVGGWRQNQLFWILHMQNFIVKNLGSIKKHVIGSQMDFEMKPREAYFHARDVIQGRWPEGESIIAQYASWSYWYARNVIRGRFIEGEAVVATHPHFAFEYANEIIKGRWPDGEEAIVSDAKWSYYYAREVLRGRFLKGEAVILNSAYESTYCEDFGIKPEKADWRKDGF